MPVVNDAKNQLVSAARAAVHVARRARGWAELRSESVEGHAPKAAIEAIKSSLTGRTSPAEDEWIHRIETIREAMLASVQPIEIVDFGAGRAAELGPDDQKPVTTETRTLSKMTQSSKPQRWALMLFNLVRELQPTTGIELGACVGVSAGYQAAAMELNGRGRLLSLEGAPQLVARSARTIDDLGLSHRVSFVEGSFALTIDEALRSIAPVQYAFIDGHHIEVATVDYMERIMKVVDNEAILVFDDIHWSAGMKRAWERICSDPRFSMFVDLGKVGLAIVSDGQNDGRVIDVAYG
jgi:predicted O-methyltransferase YrrM